MKKLINKLFANKTQRKYTALREIHEGLNGGDSGNLEIEVIDKELGWGNFNSCNLAMFY